MPSDSRNETADAVLIEMLREALHECLPWLPTEDQCLDSDRDEVAALQRRVKWLLRVRKCKKCGSALTGGMCADQTCPFSSRQQHETYIEG